nr:hypothetical protein [Tanacetum cinerariifolium]
GLKLVGFRLKWVTLGTQMDVLLETEIGRFGEWIWVFKWGLKWVPLVAEMGLKWRGNDGGELAAVDKANSQLEYDNIEKH